MTTKQSDAKPNSKNSNIEAGASKDKVRKKLKKNDFAKRKTGKRN